MLDDGTFNVVCEGQYLGPGTQSRPPARDGAGGARRAAGGAAARAGAN